MQKFISNKEHVSGKYTELFQLRKKIIYFLKLDPKKDISPKNIYG